jgi:hypothetical protein
MCGQYTTIRKWPDRVNVTFGIRLAAGSPARDVWLPGLMLLTLFAVPVASQESTMRTLLMPGELISGHAREEANCGACHQSFAKEAQDALCLDCHKEISADIDGNLGLHGRSYQAESGCKECHSDHLGRDANITPLNEDSFDHQLTDFELQGAHTQLACSSCHQQDKLWKETPLQCAECHEEAEPHRGALGKECADCHSEQGWEKAEFDHSATEFPLRGMHQETQCAACHPAQRYENTPMQCSSCHTLNDVHGGKRGQDCAMCHVDTGWEETQFEHSQKTDFVLRGVHADLQCQSCHSGTDMKQVLGETCIACHDGDDVHNSRNGENCADCHSNDSWQKANFKHDTDTSFPLRGLHRELSCESCHFSGTVRLADTRDCGACHADDDPHRAADSQNCVRCHQESGWQKLIYSHDLGKFPLLGMHASMPCESCHLSKVYSEVSTSCIGCHEQDDYHAGTVGDDCGLCHNPADWQRWQFNHDTQTEFSLTGSHVELSCQDCHREGENTALRKDCYSCHRSNDRHRGEFGRECSRCHNTDVFQDVEIVH